MESQRVSDDECGHAEYRVAEDVEGDEQPVIPVHHDWSGLADHRFNLVAEPRAAKSFGVAPDHGRVELAIDGAPDRLGKGGGAWRRRRESRFPPDTTVSIAPPRAYATTGRPHACASSGTIPKSSSPGRITTAAPRYSSRKSSSLRRPRNSTWLQSASGPGLLDRPAAAACRSSMPRSGPSPTIFSGTRAMRQASMARSRRL